MALHRGPRLRRDPQPLEPGATPPAGSSGGSAAAVAAGLLPAAVGSDGAGSVRIPAAWTHLVGLKPQRGRVSTWPEPEAFNGLTCYGPLARTVGDAALLLDVLAGNVAGDLHSPPAPAEPFAAAAARDPGRLRIALALNVPFSGSPGRSSTRWCGRRSKASPRPLEDLGHEVEPVDVPYGLAPGASIMPRSMVGIREWAERAPDRSQLDPRTHHAARLGRALRPLLAGRPPRREDRRPPRRAASSAATTSSSPRPRRSRRCRSAPATGLSSWETDKRIVAACPYAWPWNVLGWPGVNVPAGFTPDGLPLGAQLLGPANSEPRLLAVSAPSSRPSAAGTSTARWRKGLAATAQNQSAMPTARVVPPALSARICLALGALALAALMLPALAAAAPKPAVLTFTVAKVGAPGNPPVAIIPFEDLLFRNCAEAPSIPQKPCMEVGGVGYRYGIGKLEVTVAQYVDFLNTVDPGGTRKKLRLYSTTESSKAWPRFGQIDFSRKAKPGSHFSVASPEWADKPYGFANFLRSARFANSLYNGQVLSKKENSEGAFKYTTYRVRLSRTTETGMYEMRNPKTTRQAKAGFVIPSQDEWIKSAYYAPDGSGTYSYWKYPTNPGVVGQKMADGPVQAQLDATTGDVVNATGQPLAIFHNLGENSPAPPYWCPPAFTTEVCASANPLGLDAETYGKAFAGSLGTVGQSLVPSPWGTLDQGGNAVEWTDTITPPPFGVQGARVWRRLHGGIANAPSYQLWISAVGLQPQDNAFFTATYPWLGIRIGVIGNLKPS